VDVIRPTEDELADLASYVLALYDEMDKLAKKAPSALLSDFALGRVNRALHDAKAVLAKHDRYAADITEFVPAGENPEVRDGVLALREVRQALVRVRRRFEEEDEYESEDEDEDQDEDDEAEDGDEAEV
jgi:hypothetical protein